MKKDLEQFDFSEGTILLERLAEALNPSEEFSRSSKARILGQISQEQESWFVTKLKDLRIFLMKPFKSKKLVAALSLGTFLFFVGTSGVSAAYQSLPGQTLYPIRQSLENAQVAFANTPEDKALIRLEQAESRFVAAGELDDQELINQLINDATEQIQAAVELYPSDPLGLDDIRFSNGAGYASYEIDSNEAWWNSGKPEGPNTGYKIPVKRGYFPTPPMDKTAHIRQEMMTTLEQVGIRVEKGHHEVGAAGQGEINFRFGELLEAADDMQKFKYVLRNVGMNHEKFVTFLPKPLAGDNGSGMHTHLSIWKDNHNIFSGSTYSGLSDTALFAIGGIIKHASAIAAFTNPITNSYHRLVPGFEAPVRLAYSARNRSAAIRIPATSGEPAENRFEVRFPDPSSNPYLAFSALLMAAIDGIEKKIDPGNALDKDIYGMSDRDLENVPQMPSSLQEAIDALRDDNQFLRRSHVFSPEFIEMWIEAKQKEIDEIRLVPHPKEFELYCDV